MRARSRKDGSNGEQIEIIRLQREKRGSSRGNLSIYTTSHQLNTANQPTQMTYPSGPVINLGHDNKGRLTSVGSYLTGVTYNGLGQLTGTSLGNGVSESYGYDANRMQLTSQTATQSGGPTGGLLNLTYGYTTHLIQQDDLFELVV